MKKALIIMLITVCINFGQSGMAPPNSILKNFKPFDTPRTNCRPGTVYRIDENGVKYIVQDVSSIKSKISQDGTLIGQMTFTKEEMLAALNLNFDLEYITAEVEIKDAAREYTEQANVNYILWENDIAEDIVIDEKSRYFIIRETVAAQEISIRFNHETVGMLVTGKSNLKEKEAGEGETIDFPFSMKKKFNEPKRLFYLEEKIPFED